MIIGIPKEIKANENRVSATPKEVKELIINRHEVLIEENAGIASNISDSDYEAVGAKIVDKQTIFEKSDIIYKVKEILPPEYDLLREGMTIVTYIHSNASRSQTDALLASKVIAIAYEDIEDEIGNFPLLEPMSDIAGKGGFLKALEFSQKINDGSGLMLTEIPGLPTPQITVMGGGTAGLAAAKLANRFGNKVAIFDISEEKLDELRDVFDDHVELIYSEREKIVEYLKKSDVLINCVLWPKSREDHLINKKDLKLMKKGSLIVDVSCDEGGAIETSRPTSHNNPVYKVDGILHYVVDNIPSAFSETATKYLAQKTLPYVLKLANNGVEKTLINDKYFRKGLTCYKGDLTLAETGKKQNRNYITPEEALGIKS